MIQFLCEHFDTSQVRVAGTSSGAVCAAVMLILERAGPHRKNVRAKAIELFQMLQTKMAPIVTHPMSAWGKLGRALEDTLGELVPADAFPVAPGRFVIGMRQATLCPIPHLPCVAATEFPTREDFVSAVLASSTVFRLVTPGPFRRYRGRLCSDGVNPFSLWCVIDTIIHMLTGRATTTCPAHTINGDRRLPWNYIYPAWNVAVMEALLPRRQPGCGKEYWLTPSVGGNIQVQWSLLISGPWAFHLYTHGYRHARSLYESGYFDGLAPRRASLND